MFTSSFFYKFVPMHTGEFIHVKHMYLYINNILFLDFIIVL